MPWHASMPRLLVATVLMALAGCSGSTQVRTPLCGPSGTLRIGVMQPEEGMDFSSGAGLSPMEQEQLGKLLTLASGCQVELEPLASPERARMKLADRQWDAAFLPPGLTAFALRADLGYVPLRTLGRRQASRSALLVREDSPLRKRSDLNGAHVGLLPRGALGGYYFPLYNMHGLNLGRVSFAFDYNSLLSMLQEGEVEAIAWDEALPDPGAAVRRLHINEHAIPLGALVLSRALAQADYTAFLKTLDGAASQMPVSVGYSAAALPRQDELQPLKGIVGAVESWNMPLEGQPHRVYGVKEAP